MKLNIIKRHRTNYPNPIKFERGDTLHLGELDEEYPGWIRVVTKDQNEGWAPVAYIDTFGSTEFGTANTPYIACELNVNPGDQLDILKELNGWYW